MSGNRNININTADPEDNPKLSLKKTSMRTLELVVIIISASAAYIVVWFMSIAITNFYCWSKQADTCIASDIVHTVFIIGIIASFVALGFYVVQVIANAKYLYQRGIYLDRDSIARHAQGLIDVIRVSAQSEATYGLDTYSPSADTPTSRVGQQIGQQVVGQQAGQPPLHKQSTQPNQKPAQAPVQAPVQAPMQTDSEFLEGILVQGSVIDDVIKKTRAK